MTAGKAVTEMDWVYIFVSGLWFLTNLVFTFLLYAFLEGREYVVAAAWLNFAIGWIIFSLLAVRERKRKNKRITIFHVILGPLMLWWESPGPIRMLVAAIIAFAAFQMAAVQESTTTEVWYVYQIMACFCIVLVGWICFYLAMHATLVIDKNVVDGGVLDPVVAMTAPMEGMLRMSAWTMGKSHEMMGGTVMDRNGLKK